MEPTDARIIEALLSKEQTIYELSLTLFKTADKRQFLKHRLGNLAADGLVKRRTGESSVYYVPLEDITLGRAKTVVHAGKQTYDLDMGKVLVLGNNGGERRFVFLKKL